MLEVLYQLSPLLLFLPGIALFEILNEKLRLGTSLPERVVAGSLTWNFVFAASSVLIGFFPHMLIAFYWVFTYLSIIVLLLFLIIKLRGLKDRNIVKPSIFGNTSLVLLFLLPIVAVVSFIAMFTQVYADWDVWAIWLPMMKSIAVRGDLLFHDYFLSKEAVAVTPPFIPLAYAWFYSITGGADYYRLIPIIYFVLFGIAVYLLAKTISGSTGIALCSTIITSTSLVTLATLFGYTLSPELPVAFFICSSMAFLAKILKGQTGTCVLLVFGASLSMLMLSRVIGLFIAYFLISISLLSSSLLYKKGIFCVALLLPFYILILNSGYLYRLTLLLPYSLILILVTRRTVFDTRLHLRRLARAFIPVLPALCYLILMGQYSGMWAYGMVVTPSYLEAYNLFSSISGGSSSQSQINLISLVRLDDIFLSNAFIILTPLILVGLVSMLRSRKPETNFLYMTFIMFLSIFLLYPDQFYPSLALDLAFIRRYVYLIPLFSVLASIGFYWLFHKLRSANNRRYESILPVVSFIVFYALSFLYMAISTVFALKSTGNTWANPLTGIFAISNLRIVLGWFHGTPIDFIVLTSLLLVALLTSIRLTELIGKSAIATRARNSRRYQKLGSLLLLSILATSSLSTLYFLQAPLADISVYGTKSRYILPNEDETLVQFFSGVPDNGAIIGYQKYYLITFSNRSVIDLSVPESLLVFVKLFRNTNLSSVVAELTTQNVRYIIEPILTESAEYSIFENYRLSFSTFDALLNSSYLILLHTDSYYNVWEIEM